MPKMLANWDHAYERLVERVAVEHRDRVRKKISEILEPLPMDAPGAAAGHYEWYLEMGGTGNEVVARIICRGITLRTVYGPLMEGGMPAPKQGSHRYKIAKGKREFVKV